MLGDEAGECGWATIDGAGSTWTNVNSFYVGHIGHGTLAIAAGGSLSNRNGLVAVYPGATGAVTVDGGGSWWESTGNLSLGYYGGVGTLATANGGTVFVGDAAKAGGAPGWLTVSDVDAGGNAGGNLWVRSGGTLALGGGAVLGDGPGEHGWATIDGTGSTWTIAGELVVGRQGNGTLTVVNGGKVVVGTGAPATGPGVVEATSGGILSGVGTINARLPSPTCSAVGKVSALRLYGRRCSASGCSCSWAI